MWHHRYPQSPHRAKAILQRLPNLVIVQDAECIDESVFQQVLATGALFLSIWVGSTASATCARHADFGK